VSSIIDPVCAIMQLIQKDLRLPARAALPLGILLGLMLAPTAAQAAGGAYAVEDAEVDRPGACKVESWASFADNRDRSGVVSFGCVFDLGRPVELNPQFDRSRSGGVWGTEFTFQAKTNILPVEQGKIGLAIQGGPTFDLVNRQSTGGFITIPATYEFNERFKINVNAGWSYDREPNWHWATWGAGFEWKFWDGKPLTLIGEVYGQFGHRDPEQPSLTDPRAQVGLRYTPVENVDFDVIYGRNIGGENANWITVGLNVRFNAWEARTEPPPRRAIIRK
jgi:hypothetical protein